MYAHALGAVIRAWGAHARIRSPLLLPGMAPIVWHDGMSPVNGLTGFGPDYGTGGYIVDLPLDFAGANAMLAALFAGKFTSLETRALMTDINFYNTETRLATVFQALFEISESGDMQTSFKMYSFRILPYADKTDILRAGVECAYVLMWAVFLRQEIEHARWFYRPALRYFTSLRNLLEVALLVSQFMMFVTWVQFIVNPSLAAFSVNAGAFQEMIGVAESVYSTFAWAAFIGLLCSLKTFRYFALQKKMTTIWLTLSRAMWDLIAFGIGCARLCCRSPAPWLPSPSFCVICFRLACVRALAALRCWWRASRLPQSTSSGSSLSLTTISRHHSHPFFECRWGISTTLICNRWVVLGVFPKGTPPFERGGITRARVLLSQLVWVYHTIVLIC